MRRTGRAAHCPCASAAGRSESSRSGAARSPAGEKREAAAAAGQQDEGVRRERKPRPQQPRRKEGAEQRKPRPVAAKAPREERLTPVSDVSVLTVGQALKVKAGNNAMDATVLEITKDGVRVQLTSGMSMIVRAEHLVF